MRLSTDQTAKPETHPVHQTTQGTTTGGLASKLAAQQVKPPNGPAEVWDKVLFCVGLF